MKKLILFSIGLGLLISSCKESSTTSEDENSTPVENSTTTTSPQRVVKDSLSEVLRKNPQDIAALKLRVQRFLDIKNTRSASLDINRLFQLDSNDSEIRYLKGVLLMLQNKSRLAKTQWEICNRLDKNSTQCRIRLAELYIAVHDYEKSLKLLNEVIAIDNSSYEGYFFKGLVVRDLQADTALALQYFQKSIDLNPNFEQGLDMMGVMLAAQNDSLAHFYYKRVIELNPNRADIYYKLGVFYMNRDETNLALENYTKAAQLNPRDADSYFNLGFMHIQLKEFALARDYFSKAIVHKEQNYKAFYGRGYSFEMVGDILNAQKDYRKAIKANPIYDPAKEGLGRVNKMINAAK